MADRSRFVRAQAGIHDVAVGEIRAGRKQSHWMWFEFPQLGGLGRSETARYYAIGDLVEARAYLADPELGPRLREIARAALEVAPPRSAEDVFGPIDAVKLRSSMTLFAEAAPDEPLFRSVLDRYFGGARDPLTLELLGRADPPG